MSPPKQCVPLASTVLRLLMHKCKALLRTPKLTDAHSHLRPARPSPAPHFSALPEPPPHCRTPPVTHAAQGRRHGRPAGGDQDAQVPVGHRGQASSCPGGPPGFPFLKLALAPSALPARAPLQPAPARPSLTLLPPGRPHTPAPRQHDTLFTLFTQTHSPPFSLPRAGSWKWLRGTPTCGTPSGTLLATTRVGWAWMTG